MIVIEKGIPFPLGLASEKGPTRSDLAKMEVGDSFTVEAADLERTRLKVSAYGKATEKVFTVRKQSDGTHRCWRLS